MSRSALLLTFAAVLAPAWVSSAETALKVGLARVDVTPDFPVRLGGYLARDTESGRVAQRIWAKALAIGTEGRRPVVLVSVDNLGVGAAVVEEVAGRLQRKAGLSRERLAVASSHTHSAPCLTGVAPHIFGKTLDPREQAAVDRYTRELTDKLERVSLDALGAGTPGKLAWAQGSVGFAANRRTPGGPVDHSLPALRVTGPDGTLRAVVVNYACHCTTIDPKENAVSGDWAGFAQEGIEADHPAALAMTVIGCGADANPHPRRNPGDAAAHGRAVADEVNRLLRATWTDLPGPPEATFRRFTLPFDALPTRDELARLVRAGGPAGYNASVFLDRLDRGEPIPTRLDYSAQAWRFGDRLAMVFLPGEVVVDYVLRLKRELDPARLWVTAYANDLPCYIPSERVLKEGGYEGGGAMVYYARPARLKPGVEQLIIDAVHRVVGDAFLPNAAGPPTGRAPGRAGRPSHGSQ